MVRRFVIQEHMTPEGVHWDLMLEQDDVLATFRLEQEPAYCLTHDVRAEKIFDHPLRFLTYEGPVQKGTGNVKIADSGAYLRRDDRDDLLTLELNGAVLRGDFVLIRLNDAEWRFGPQHPPV
jgi:hypothetical protein